MKGFLEKYNDFHVEEVDLYKDHIPRLEYQYFEGRNAIIKEEDAEKLDAKDQKEIKRIRELCDQFVDAQVYVIASPMWSLSFPAPLKEYIDCIVQVGKTIEFVNNKPKGLLDNQGRVLVYIESSGGKIPWILDPVMDKGENYVASIMRTLGIKKVEELMVSGTGTTEEERQEAISNAIEKIDEIINSISL